MKYTWKTRPYRHQVAAVKQTLAGLKKWGSFALLMAPRTGKTKVAIDVMSILHQMGEVNRVVVVGPVSVIDVWIREIKLHCPVRWRITIWDKDGRKEVDLPPMGQDILDIILINYEAFSAPGAVIARKTDKKTGKTSITKRSRSRGGRFEMKRKIRAWQPQMMILDESHRIKTPSARKTTMIWSLAWNIRTNVALIRYRMILTGTVLTKKKRIFDIYSQWKFLNRHSKLLRIRDEETGKWRIMQLKEFKDKHAVWTERNGYPQWLRNRPGPMSELTERLHKESFAITRDECYDLPKAFPPVIHRIPLEESAPYYDQMAEEMVAMLESGEFTWAKIPLVQRLRLQQITSGIVKTEPTDRYPEGRIVRVGREKMRWLEDVLYDQFEAEEKVVIGGRFVPDLNAVHEVCKKLKVPTWELSGRIKRGQRTINIDQFNKYQGPAAFIAQPAAGALGIDLSSSATMLWYSLTSSWVDYTQFRDRVALSERAVRHIYLLGEGTVDELLYDVLQEDGDMARCVTDSPRRLLRNFKNEKVARK